MSPLKEELERIIALEGPITVERYMALCLGHPVHGYYTNRDPLGAGGDFTTAPEISQMFGELIGLWAIEAWRAMGEPRTLGLVELGPGRGTLMADVLRAARVAPSFLDALRVHLVETSPALRDRQRTALESTPVSLQWHDGIEEVPDGPAVVLANEFFDALPVRQFVATDRGWCERLVGLGAEGLAFGLAPEPRPDIPFQAPPGQVLEDPVAAGAVVDHLAQRLVQQGGAALVIDYGHAEPGLGDTLQAVKGHAYAEPLAEPGEADLTVHVDFHTLAGVAWHAGAAVHGPATQGDFLRELGIELRAKALATRATPPQVEAIESAKRRLTGDGPQDMGHLFKVMALADPKISVLPALTRQE